MEESFMVILKAAGSQIPRKVAELVKCSFNIVMALFFFSINQSSN